MIKLKGTNLTSSEIFSVLHSLNFPADVDFSYDTTMDDCDDKFKHCIGIDIFGSNNKEHWGFILNETDFDSVESLTKGLLYNLLREWFDYELIEDDYKDVNYGSELAPF